MVACERSGETAAPEAFTLMFAFVEKPGLSLGEPLLSMFIVIAKRNDSSSAGEEIGAGVASALDPPPHAAASPIAVADINMSAGLRAGAVRRDMTSSHTRPGRWVDAARNVRDAGTGVNQGFADGGSQSNSERASPSRWRYWIARW